MSCEFNPSKEYYLDLQKPTLAPEVEIELNFNNAEQIVFYWQTNITIRLKNDSLKLIKVDFFLDNVLLQTYEDENGFYTTIDIYGSENHKFKIEFITNSGSNSIADNLGDEQFLFSSKEWTFVAKNPDYLNASSFLTNKGMFIHWKAYDGLNFKKYLVKKLAVDLTYEVSDTSFLDTEYVGEKGHYEIYVVDDQDKQFVWADCWTESNLPVLRLDELDKKLILAWDTTGFEDEIKEYVITSRNSYGIWEDIATVSPYVTHIFLGNYKFGELKDFYLRAVPKKTYNSGNEGLFLSNMYTRMGIPVPNFNSYYGSSPKGFLYEYNNLLHLYSTVSNSSQSIVAQTINILITPNFEYLLIPKSTTLELYGEADFHFIKSVNINTIIPSEYTPYWDLKISDNGLVAIICQNKMYVYDILNEVIIAEKQYDKQYYFVLSPDGKYLVLYDGNNVITNEIVGNTIVELNQIANPSGYYSYSDFLIIPDEPDKIYSFKNSQITVRSIKDLSTIRTFNTGNDFFYNVDFENDKVLTYKMGNFYIHDFVTGNLVETIPSDISGASNLTLLCNNTLFCTGFKYYLKN